MSFGLVKVISACPGLANFLQMFRGGYQQRDRRDQGRMRGSGRGGSSRARGNRGQGGRIGGRGARRGRGGGKPISKDDLDADLDAYKDQV